MYLNYLINNTILARKVPFPYLGTPFMTRELAYIEDIPWKLSNPLKSRTNSGQESGRRKCNRKAQKPVQVFNVLIYHVILKH